MTAKRTRKARYTFIGQINNEQKGVTMNTKQLIQAIAANIAAGATLTDAIEAAMGCEQYGKMVAVLLKAIQQGRDKVTLNEIMEDVCE